MGRTQRTGPPDEKLTINLGPVNLGRIDLLVAEGLYSTRTDFIRAAIRRQLDDDKQVVEEATVRREFTVGYVSLRGADLERTRKSHQKLRVRVIGVLRIADDVSPPLADDVFEEIWVLGQLRAPRAVLERLGPKVVRGTPAEEERSA
jgi:Arc/MetJ-type ribon-helix-helix transcriptional regulator